MKIRAGFVSNSSSCAFTITNTSDEEKTLLDFVLENASLFDDFEAQYGWGDEPTVNWHRVLKEAERNVIGGFPLKPHESKRMVFGDESCTQIGKCFDYMLRGGGASWNFVWKFVEMLR